MRSEKGLEEGGKDAGGALVGGRRRDALDMRKLGRTCRPGRRGVVSGYPCTCPDNHGSSNPTQGFHHGTCRYKGCFLHIEFHHSTAAGVGGGGGGGG